MVDAPAITEMPNGELLIFDNARVPPKHDWRFLGWLLLGAMAMIIFYDIRSWQFTEGLSDYAFPLAGVALGVLLVRIGERPQIVQRPLLEVSSDRAWISRYGPTGPEQHAVSSLTHVVFGMIDHPWPGNDEVKIEAFALYLARADGTPIPIIDACIDRLRTFRLAQALSKILGRPLIQLGKGMQDPL